MCQLILLQTSQHLLLLLNNNLNELLTNITAEKRISIPTMCKWQVHLFSGRKWNLSGGRVFCLFGRKVVEFNEIRHSKGFRAYDRISG